MAPCAGADKACRGLGWRQGAGNERGQGNQSNRPAGRMEPPDSAKF